MVKYFYQINEKFYRFGEQHHFNIFKLYLIAGFLIGCLYSVCTPMMQIPDETTHYRNMFEAVGMEGVHEQCMDLADQLHSIDTVGARIQKQDFNEYLKAWSVAFDREGIEIHPQLKLSVLRYFPAICGFLLGYTAHLPILWCLQLAEIFMLLFSLAIGYRTLKMIPIHRELMCAILLLPTAIEMCASVNYDAVLLPLCFFFTAYVLKLKYQDEKGGWGSLLVLGVLISVISSIKILYFLLILLVFIIPLKQFELRLGRWDLIDIIKKHRILWYTFMVFAFVLGCYLIRNNLYILAVRAMLLNPARALEIMDATRIVYGKLYLKSMIGTFGWLDSFVSLKYSFFVMFSLLLFSQAGDEAQNRKRNTAYSRALTFSVTSVLILLIIFCMLIWTFEVHEMPTAALQDFQKGIYNIYAIEGVQGRYFLPVLFWGFYVVEGVVRLKKERMVIYQGIYYILLAIVPTVVLMKRFWI